MSIYFFAVMTVMLRQMSEKNCTINTNTHNTYLYLYYKIQVKCFDYSRYIIYKNAMQQGDMFTFKTLNQIRQSW